MDDDEHRIWREPPNQEIRIVTALALAAVGGAIIATLVWLRWLL